jgi:hypothetical protein
MFRKLLRKYEITDILLHLFLLFLYLIPLSLIIYASIYLFKTQPIQDGIACLIFGGLLWSVSFFPVVFIPKIMKYIEKEVEKELEQEKSKELE